jgi:hypothetical protein
MLFRFFSIPHRRDFMKIKKWLVLGGGLAVAAQFLILSASAWQLQYAPVMTGWAQLVDTNNPLPEYPRPQMVRTNWLNLNGIWQFQAGATNDPAPTNQTLSGDILVPFPMESALSGVAQYHAWSWYRRTFVIPAAWSGQHILLHLDAVDWQSQVFINGSSLGIHRGGYDPVTYDITAYLTGSGPQELIVQVYSPEDSAGEPRGKQSLYPGGIMYTSSSGIWQPVWLEPVPATSVSNFKLVPDIDNARLNITVNVAGPTNGVTVNAVAHIGPNVVGTVSGPPGANLLLPVPNPNLWWPTNPFLYDLTVTLSNGPALVDSVDGYFGMRKISLGTNNGFIRILLNNQFVFQFGPLDQGFWPDGIYTAPTDAALKSDIELEKNFGFNLVRKHIKVERQRWYYWADKLGILVWQDMPSCNSYTGNPNPPPVDPNQFITELTRLVQNHWNSPAIVMWTLFNESQGQENTGGGVGQTNTAYLVQLVKSLDPSRLINQASGGNYYGVGDIFDNHSYPSPGNPSSTTQATVDSEFGGVALYITNHTWAPGGGEGSATDTNDLASQFETFCTELSTYAQDDGLSGAIYTQTTDVETELNGLYTYDRAVRKPDLRRIQVAIAGAGLPVVLTTVVPTSQSSGLSWQYTTNNPSANWYTTGFDASAWSNGAAGFGAGNPPNTAGLVRTPWNTADIWLRRTVNPGPLTTQQISNLVFFTYHDEDVEIYINGVLAGSASGYSTSYVFVPMTAAGQAAIVPNSNNLIAVHCHQTTGGQYIDVGIDLHSNVVVALPPVPATPTNLIAADGPLGVSLGWDNSPGAASYNVKRSLVSGGPYTNIVLTPALNATTDSTVSNSTTYYYVVSAANVSGESGNSAEIAVTTVTPPPPPVPLLTTWFKADALTGLANGAPVSIWRDASGNGDDASQSNSSQRPTFVADVINGLPAVRFTSASQTYLSFPRPVSGDFTIVCLFRSTQGLNTGTLFYQGAGIVNGEVSGTVNDFGTCLFTNGSICAGTGNPDVAVNSGPGFNDGQPHIFTFTRKRNTGAMALYVDGTLVGTATGGLETLTAPAELVLGAQQTLLNFLSGDIAEVKIYDGALGDTDRIAVENSLRCKYGLGSGTPPAAPANLAATTDNQSVFLNWNPGVAADSYILYRATNAAGSFAIAAMNVTATNYVDANPAGGRANYYKVASVSSCGTGPTSAAASVTLASPTLGFAASGNAGTFSVNWPDWGNNWTLWYATNLAPPVTWLPVTNSVSESNGQITVTVPIESAGGFFRLTSP